MDPPYATHYPETHKYHFAPLRVDVTKLLLPTTLDMIRDMVIYDETRKLEQHLCL